MVAGATRVEKSTLRHCISIGKLALSRLRAQPPSRKSPDAVYTPFRHAQPHASGAGLTSESATLAMVALRVYAALLEQPSMEPLGQPYEVAVIDADEHKTEILALCRNFIVAKAAFVAAVEQRAGKRGKLTRGAHVHADSGDKRS